MPEARLRVSRTGTRVADAARELPLEDALQLARLNAERGSPKYEKAALRWLERYLTQGSRRRVTVLAESAPVLGLVAVHRHLVQACRSWSLQTSITCATGGVALAYQVFGKGPVELVYAPQWINNLEVAWSNPLYARFLSRLASFARVVFVDRRGMGLSDRLSATDVPPLETLTEDLRIVIDSAE